MCRGEDLGERLPEPVVTSPDVAEDVELVGSVPIAVLAVLRGRVQRATVQ